MGQKLDLLSLTARGCRFLCGFKRVQSLSFPVLVDREVPKGAWRWEMRKPTPVPARPLRALGLDRSFQES